MSESRVRACLGLVCVRVAQAPAQFSSSAHMLPLHQSACMLGTEKFTALRRRDEWRRESGEM